MSTFTELHLDDRILEALASEGYTTPTPVQAATIPALLDGRDVLGVAQTGTGKTAAFALPILHQLAATKVDKPRPIRALMLTPTRELAAKLATASASMDGNSRSSQRSFSVVWVNLLKSKHCAVALTCWSPHPADCWICTTRGLLT